MIFKLVTQAQIQILTKMKSMRWCFKRFVELNIMVGCVDWDYDLFQVGILVSYQSSLSQSASTTKSNLKAKLENVKLELAEM